MKSNQKIALIPVIELPPATYRKTDRVAPTKKYLEAPQEWFDYHQNSYLDAGLTHLQAIEPLSCLFVEPKNRKF